MTRKATIRRYLRIIPAAEYLGQTERFMRRLVSERRIRFYKAGRYITFDIADLDAFMEAGRVEPIEGRHLVGSRG